MHFEIGDISQSSPSFDFYCGNSTLSTFQQILIVEADTEFSIVNQTIIE